MRDRPASTKQQAGRHGLLAAFDVARGPQQTHALIVDAQGRQRLRT
jgi:hypothetical protein